jgi:hypothetical protein
MKKLLFSIYAAALIVAGCSSKKTIFLSDNSGPISFFVNTAGYYPDNKIMKCKLSDTATLNEYKCISWIWFFENGQIKQFETAADIKMNNFVIPSNSTIFFDERNPGKIKYIWFSKDVTINNIQCKGSGEISTEFYDNNSLKSCFLAKNQNIQGFPCQSSLFKPVCFYPNGKIKILPLSIKSKYGDKVYKSGESILVKEDGKVSKFEK